MDAGVKIAIGLIIIAIGLLIWTFWPKKKSEPFNGITNFDDIWVNLYSGKRNFQGFRLDKKNKDLTLRFIKWLQDNYL